jgi:hypothetical protein
LAHFFDNLPDFQEFVNILALFAISVYDSWLRLVQFGGAEARADVRFK